MRPQEVNQRTVRIRLVVGMVVMLPMDGDPAGRRVLKAAQTEDRERVLQPFRADERAMGQQPMKAQADAERAEHIQAGERDNDAGPAEEPRHKRQQRKKMRSPPIRWRRSTRREAAGLSSALPIWVAQQARSTRPGPSVPAAPSTSRATNIGTPTALGQRPKRTHARRRTAERRTKQADHRDTPPEDVLDVAAGLLAHGSALLSGLPKADGLSDANWTATRRLQLRGQLRH